MADVLSHRKLTSTGDLYALFNFAGPYQILAGQRGGDCGGRFLGAGGNPIMAVMGAFIAMVGVYGVGAVFGTIAVVLIAIAFFTTFKEAKS